MTKITFISDQPKDWTEAIDKATTLPDLKRVGASWDSLCWDANTIIQKMTPNDFRQFRAGLRKERKGVHAGEKHTEKYGAILMPENLFKVSIFSMEFQVPWGLAFIRMSDHKLIETNADGHIIVNCYDTNRSDS